jgi:hypothetical protein
VMGNIFYCVGYCPVCETGPLGARICGACGHAWVQCDECESLWADPDRNKVQSGVSEAGPKPGADVDLPCPACGRSLWEPPSHWASLDELERLGWHDRIVAQGAALPEASRAADEREETPWARPAEPPQAKRSSRKRRGRRRPD